MNQWRTRSQYCAKGGAWITGSWSVKATSGWQLLYGAMSAADGSPLGSPTNKAWPRLDHSLSAPNQAIATTLTSMSDHEPPCLTLSAGHLSGTRTAPEAAAVANFEVDVVVRVGGALGAKVVPRMLRIVVGPRVRERLHRGGIVARCTPSAWPDTR